MTKRLYWAKPYQKTFTAKVLDVKNGALILDKTLFYATSGNQIHDTGVITINQKDFQVINVEKGENDIFIHFTDPKPTNELVGHPIKGKIDWERRYSVMKAHTAQHVVSAIMMKKFNNMTQQANIKPGEFSIEFTQKITREELESTMQEANQLFTSHSKKISSHVLKHDEADTKYKSKIRGKIPNVETVRILEVEDTDYNTCGGTHIKNSSEIGPVFVTNIHRDCEVDFLCGEMAISSLSISNVNVIYSLIGLNCSLKDYPDVFQKKFAEIEKLQQEQKEHAVLIMDLLQSSSFEDINKLKVRFIEADLPRKIVFKAFKKFKPDSVLIIKSTPIQYLILSSSKKFPAKMIVEKLKDIHGGRGGGSPLNAQILFDSEPKDIQKDIKQILTF